MNPPKSESIHPSSFILHPFLVVRQASAAYPVFVGRGLLDSVLDIARPRGKVFVITSAALRRFGERVARGSEIITIEEGETNKTLATANAIVTQLLDRGGKRDSMAIVVGGGMIGDTAGFAASIFLRGIDLVHVPTTLLAQVDSSIGGKVAVNHERGKNLIGSFYPPRAVVADTAILDSLPPRERLSGLYEALKGGVIGDASLYEMLERRAEVDLDTVVRKAIKVKADIVSADEKEADLRRLLNYGHTLAHGIEAALGYEQLTHGEAVAWGIIGANAIGVRRGVTNDALRRRIDDAVRDWQPSPLPPLGAEAVLAATEHDKKNTGSSRVMVFAREIGRCEVVSGITDTDLRYGMASIGIQ
ncbi:MAG TPA: 3-dehydroquinate synthase [Thermoanaerobaculia bacterium]|nr:3-dehydroquinate synthase [Thermoanaerobaculia bacterium]